MPAADLRPVEAYPVGVTPFSGEFRRLINAVAEVAYWTEANREELERVIMEVHPVSGGAAGNVPFLGLTTSFTLIASNRWTYGWAEGEFAPPSNVIAKPGGRASSDQEEAAALNLAEMLNTTATAAHGVVLNSPEATGTVAPLPNGTPIFLHFLSFDSGSGTNFRAFSEVNAVNFACSAPAGLAPEELGFIQAV